MTEKDFNVGDIVVVKTWDEMAEEYGIVERNGFKTIDVPHGFYEHMIDFCSKQYYITGIAGNRISLEVPGYSRACSRVSFYVFSPETLRHAYASEPEASRYDWSDIFFK